MTSTLLRAPNMTLLSKVRQRFFQILWLFQKTQTLKKEAFYLLTQVIVLGQKSLEAWLLLCWTGLNLSTGHLDRVACICPNQPGKNHIYQSWKVAEFSLSKSICVLCFLLHRIFTIWPKLLTFWIKGPLFGPNFDEPMFDVPDTYHIIATKIKVPQWTLKSKRNPLLSSQDL